MQYGQGIPIDLLQKFSIKFLVLLSSFHIRIWGEVKYDNSAERKNLQVLVKVVVKNVSQIFKVASAPYNNNVNDVDLSR